MKNYLKFSEFLEQAPDDPGFVRVNHDSDECSGSSKSLKIERKEDGSIHAHCFRCSRSGLYSPEFKRVRETQKSIESTRHAPKRHSIDFPRDGTTRTGDWPLYAVKWIRQWGLTNEELSENTIAFSPLYDRICFGIFYDGAYSGYASRAVSPEDTRPKWMRFTDGSPWYKRTDAEGSRVLVLVEDVVSAIRVLRQADCIALLTTSISTKTLADIAGYDRYVVWLDDDNKTVKMNQLKLARRLSLLGNTQVIHSTDPKRLSDEDIQQKIFGYC